MSCNVLIDYLDEIARIRATRAGTALAGCPPAWLSENADGIRQDLPHLPLPDSAALLRASADLAIRVAALLDPDLTVSGVTTGSLNPTQNQHGFLNANIPDTVWDFTIGGYPLTPGEIRYARDAH